MIYFCKPPSDTRNVCSKGENGAILLMVLALIALLGLVNLKTQNTLRRSWQELAALKHRNQQKADILKQNILCSKHLDFLDPSCRQSHINVLSASTAALLTIESRSTSQRVSLGTVRQLFALSPPIGSRSIPSWHKLQSQIALIPCSTPSSTETLESHLLSSAVVCRDISDLDTSNFIDGNLRQETPLVVNFNSAEGITLAIRGELELKQLIIHSKEEVGAGNLHLNIIAFADLLIAEIVNQSSRTVTINLHSTLGKVETREIGETISICNSARDSCFKDSDSLFWPRYQTLGFSFFTPKTGH